jgi:uncharacterized protein (TIGR03083 family)
MTLSGATAELVRTERLALVELLERLDEAHWSVPSLCEGWTVRDVAAHLAWASAMSPLEMAVGMARAGLRVNRFVETSARGWSRRGRDAILEQLAQNAERGTKPLGMPPAAVVTDAVIHQLDVRRPLERPRPVPEDAFRLTADFLLGAGARPPGSVLLGGTVRRRTKGLRLTASDCQWSSGSGPEIGASSETLLLVLAGRAVDRTELDGPGADELATRLR